MNVAENMKNKWCLSIGEPRILDDDFSEFLSTPITGYRMAYDIIYQLMQSLCFPKVCLEIILCRRCVNLCGKCFMYKKRGDINNCYTILLYKGYYTLGVLLHEYAHVIVNERRNRYDEEFNNEHDQYFKAWLLILVRQAMKISI